jgi:hypothetical protein
VTRKLHILIANYPAKSIDKPIKNNKQANIFFNDKTEI